MNVITVLPVGNEEVFRDRLAKLLNNRSHIEIVHQLGNCKEAIKSVVETVPYAILMIIIPVWVVILSFLYSNH